MRDDLRSASLIPPHRGEVSGAADGVLPSSLNLCYNGDKRGPQVGHQHQETDAAQHSLV